MTEQQILYLLIQWETECGYLSNPMQWYRHVCCRRLIYEGVTIVPTVLLYLDRCQMSDRYGSLPICGLLASIMGFNAIKPEHRGKVREAQQDWLKWGKKHGIWNP